VRALSLYVPLAEKLPRVELKDSVPAVANPPEETVTLMVTVFFGEELSDTISDVVPEAIPLIVTVFELIDAEAIALEGCVVIA
jgi:hypothetical protein